MEEKRTEELNHILEGMKPSQINHYLRENSSEMRDEKKSFYYFFKDTLAKKRIRLSDVYVTANVSESYGGQIIRMEKHTKNRDLIIRLCIGGHFTWHETSRALKLYGLNELYSRNPRDVCIICALNDRIFDPYRINALLLEEGQSLLAMDEA